MTKRTNPITRLVKRLVQPSQAQPVPEPEELEPTEKVNYRFIKYGD